MKNSLTRGDLQRGHS